MRPRALLICIILLLGALVLVLYRTRQLKNNVSQTQSVAASQQSVSAAPSSSAVNSISPASAPNSVAIHHSAPMTSNELLQAFMAEWQTPIDFYGKVIDENSNPVEGASISFQWAESPTNGVAKVFSTQSDANGLFSLERQRGPMLDVYVSKDGYYTSRKDRTGFSYGSLAPGKFTPDILNPVVFHLYKKRQGANLITSQYGINPYFPVFVPRDGSPVHVDLLQRKIDPSGDLEMSQTKPDDGHWQLATNWSFHMSLPDGGFVETDDAFLFSAPENGYQPSVDFDFEKNSTNWATQISNDYYIKFGTPPKYGWLHIDANIGQQTAILKYAINPDGSRNLEPK